MVPAEAEEELVAGGEVLVDARGEAVPLEGVALRAEEVVDGVRGGRDVGQWVQVLQHARAHGVPAVGWDQVAGERRADGGRAGGDGGVGVGDGDGAAGGVDGLRKVARALEDGGDDEGRLRLRWTARALVVEEEECPVAAVVELGKDYGSAERGAEGVLAADRFLLAVEVGKEGCGVEDV